MSREDKERFRTDKYALRERLHGTSGLSDEQRVREARLRTKTKLPAHVHGDRSVLLRGEKGTWIFEGDMSKLITWEPETCVRCKKHRVAKADLGIDVLMTGVLEASPAMSCMQLDLPLCGNCFRKLGVMGLGRMVHSSVHLSTRGVVRRLTHKQTENLKRKRAREILEAARRELADYGDDE